MDGYPLTMWRGCDGASLIGKMSADGNVAFCGFFVLLGYVPCSASSPGAFSFGISHE